MIRTAILDAIRCALAAHKAQSRAVDRAAAMFDCPVRVMATSSKWSAL